MDTTTVIIHGIFYGLAIALSLVAIIELVSRYYEKRKIEEEAFKDKKIKKEIEGD